MIHEYQDFKAVHNLMPGSGLPLRVDGVCVFTTSGHSARLEAAEGNTGPGLEMLMLDLVITEPPPGTAVTEVLTPVPVHYEEETEILYKEVGFQVRGSEDAPPSPIPVEEVH
jgi:hypothetical protein